MENTYSSIFLKYQTDLINVLLIVNTHQKQAYKQHIYINKQ